MSRFWLVLVLAAVVGRGWLASACPEHCSCRYEQGLYVANCSSLPSSGGKIESLTLLPSHTPLELVDGQFNSARHLKYLSLRNCSIYFIHKKTFYGAKNVFEIDLSNNLIEELEPTVFQHLTSLTTLVMRGNPIQFLSEVPFLISNSLQHLDVGSCKIKHIPRGVFWGLKRLKYLSLDNNLIKSIKYNSLPKGLKYIDISNNLIVNVPTEVISSLTNLRRLGLGGNPINCSCALMNLQDWLSGRGVIFEDDVMCALPPQYKGVSWTKVNENALCLAEVRREEMYHSIYNPLFRNRLYRENYFENENSYQGETLQADQPQLYTNSDAEVLFQNDETLAMGEMMRDEDGVTDKVETDMKKNAEDETVEDVSKYNNTDSKAAESQDVNLKNQESHNENGETQKSNPETVVSELDNNENGETQNSNPETVVSELDNNDTHSTQNTGEDNSDNLEMEANPPTLDTVNLNYSKPVEFKTLSDEDSNTETDDLKNEGLLHAGSVLFTETNNTSERSTVLPDIEDTTEDEVPSTEETPDLGSHMFEEDLNEDSQNLTSSTETNNGTTLEYSENPQEDIEDTIPPPTTVSDLYSENNTTETNNNGVVNAPTDGTEATTETTLIGGIKEMISKKEAEKEAEKVKKVAGAEVVIFCIAVLIVCLLLYSVYRCRTSKNRQTMRIVKDKPLNRDTEMQDMASLLPKPQDGENKNYSKYPDKAPSSETEKLISNETEKEPTTPKVIPISETKGKLENKNTLNNNTPNESESPTSKTPLIQSGKPITINPAAPIQRTKVKVGIIPDSIPRTPIFVQKAYNGTKNV